MTADDPNLFERYTPPDMVDKLSREVRRFHAAKTRGCREDHILNFCTTAWHLFEWAWEAINVLDPDDKERLANELNSGISWPDKPSFRDWCKRECPDLGWCRQIVDLAKHAKREEPAWDEMPVDVTARPTGLPDDVDPLGAMAITTSVEYWSHEVKYGGDWQSIGVRLEVILDFWTRVMGYGLAINWSP